MFHVTMKYVALIRNSQIVVMRGSETVPLYMYKYNIQIFESELI